MHTLLEQSQVSEPEHSAAAPGQGSQKLVRAVPWEISALGAQRPGNLIKASRECFGSREIEGKSAILK